MNVSESQLKSHVRKTCSLPTGDIYLFDNIVIVEFKEGINVTIENTFGLLNIILDHFGTKSPFGLISNRVNSYALQPFDMQRVKEHITNLAAYGVVANDSAGKMGAEIENNFCQSQNILFNSLYEAADVVYQRVKDFQDIEA